MEGAEIFFPIGSVTRLVTFTGYIVTGSLPSIPAGAIGSVYSFTISSTEVYETGTATVTIPISNTANNISIYYSSDDGSTWKNIESTINNDYIQANLPSFPCMIVAGELTAN